MSYLAAAFLFPLLLAVLSLGAGLLVERLAGARLPSLLLAPVGFGALVVLAQFTTRSAAIAPLTPWLLALVALIGLGLGKGALAERWLARGRGWQWGPLSGIVAYLIVSSPLIFSGHLTFPGYLLDTTGAVQLMGAEYILHHGNSFGSVAAIPGYGQTLNAYFGNGYPSGGHAVLASVGWLSGQDLLWLISPFQAVELGLSALVLAFLAGRAGVGRLGAALAGVLAAVPALVFSYALMGSIKEITALPMLLLMGALVLCARPLAAEAGIRAAVPFGVAGGAALAAIGLAASPWVVFFGGAALLAAVPLNVPRRDGRRLVLGGAALAGATALLALPTLITLSKTLALAEGVSSSNAKAVSDPGNLLRPLSFVQSLGVWLGESHRIDPRYLHQTYVLIGIVALCIGAGLVWLLRNRLWALLAVVSISFLVRLILVRHGTEWTDAKLLVLLSPVLLLVALIGAFRGLAPRVPESALVVAVLAAGILASDALAYHGTNMAPGGRYSELRSIGSRFAGDGPTFSTDFDEYSMYLLRGMSPTGAGLAFAGSVQLVRNAPNTYGHSADPDTIVLSSIERYRTLVIRRSPERSRPPSNFHEVFAGRYYTVWQRSGPSPLIHLGLNSSFGASAPAPCRSVRRLAAAASAAGGELAYAPRPLDDAANLLTAGISSGIVHVADLEGRPELGFNGPGRLETSVNTHAAGEYELWLGGNIDSRGLEVYLDGRLVGRPAVQSGDDGNVIHVAEERLSPGRHRVTLLREGGGLQPGNNAGTVVDAVVLEPASTGRETVRHLPAKRWRSLCGVPVDWVEVVRGA